MADPNPNSFSTQTLQGIDFTTTQNADDYNSVFMVNNCGLSSQDENMHLQMGTAYPVVFAFADSINANPSVGQPTGTMQRTLNKRAVQDYDFFRECVKQKLRSSLDGFASEGVTVPLIARLSCGIYAGSHKERINFEFDRLLNEVLEEQVLPGIRRGQLFDKVLMPIL